MKTWYVVLVLGLLPAASVAAADAQCMWDHQFYGPGAMACQNGVQARCVDGAWKPTGAECADQAADPGNDDSQPGVVEPRVGEPRVIEPGARPVAPPSVPPVGD